LLFVKETKFLTGNEAVIEAATKAGATFMSGYPITPATDILELWAKIHDNNPKQFKFIQAEDEISAGFNLIGALLAGARGFTATAGPGHVLMQDAISMAEAMRLPFVGVIMQRGGPSTGTVIYGQQEVTLAAFGGNGEGLRIVYSASNPQELYTYTMRAFACAWYTKFPTLVLGDGYSAKMRSKVELHSITNPIRNRVLLGETEEPKNLRNCYNIESELAEVLEKNIADWKKYAEEIKESECYLCKDAELIFIAHGIVAQAAREAVDMLRQKGIKAGLFRPITLRPFDHQKLTHFAAKVGKIIIVESSYGHLERIVKSRLFGLTRIETYQKPVMPISPEEIVRSVK